MIFQGLKVENGLTTSLFGNSEMMNLNVFNSLLLEITPVSSYHELSPIVPFKFRGGFPHWSTPPMASHSHGATVRKRMESKTFPSHYSLKGIKPNSQPVINKNRENTRQRKNNHTHKTVFTWFSNFTYVHEVVGISLLSGKNTKYNLQLQYFLSI